MGEGTSTRHIDKQTRLARSTVHHVYWRFKGKGQDFALSKEAEFVQVANTYCTPKASDTSTYTQLHSHVYTRYNGRHKSIVNMYKQGIVRQTRYRATVAASQLQLLALPRSAWMRLTQGLT